MDHIVCSLATSCQESEAVMAKADPNWTAGGVKTGHCFSSAARFG